MRTKRQGSRIARPAPASVATKNPVAITAPIDSPMPMSRRGPKERTKRALICEPAMSPAPLTAATAPNAAGESPWTSCRRNDAPAR